MLGFLHTVDWPIYTDAVLFPDVERVLRSIRTAPNSEFGVSKKMVECRGDIWQISSSYFHPFAAMATSDGWLKLNNAFHGNKRGEVSRISVNSQVPVVLIVFLSGNDRNLLQSMSIN